MSNITRDDLKTILMFGLHISKVDNDFDIWEKKILKRFSDAIRLTDDEREGLGKISVSLGKGLNSLSSDEARNLLIKTLCAVSYADGVNKPEEVDFIEKVFSKAGGTIMVLPRDEWGTYERELFDELEALDL